MAILGWKLSLVSSRPNLAPGGGQELVDLSSDQRNPESWETLWQEVF